jgi:S-(hydroxymethyl)glutathione dehydrogenase/alcohol dehydrogenase
MIDIEVPLLMSPGAPLETRLVRVADPRPGEVLVRVVASGVCHSCLHAADGSHRGIPMPIVLGDEGAGIIEAVGSTQSELTAGDHVVLSWAPGCGRCRYCSSGRPGLCEHAPALGLLADGTTRFSLEGEPVYHYGPASYARYTVVPERAAVKIPAEVPLEVAALVGCSVTTGVGAVLNTAQVRPGESVAIFGCGGVGINAVQGAVLAGAHPIIAVDVNPAKLEMARRFGATDSVDASADDPTARILTMTGAGVDYAVVAVGSSSAIEQAWAALGPGGTCVVVGNPPTDSPPIRIDPHSILSGERRLVGSVYGSSSPLAEFPRLLSLYRAGNLKLDELITHRFTPKEANEAFSALAAGEVGRGLIVFDEYSAT